MTVILEKGDWILRRENSIIDAFVELLKVKTLITLAVTGACVWGFLRGQIPVEIFTPMVTMVLTNYFRKGKEE